MVTCDGIEICDRIEICVVCVLVEVILLLIYLGVGVRSLHRLECSGIQNISNCCQDLYDEDLLMYCPLSYGDS